MWKRILNVQQHDEGESNILLAQNRMEMEAVEMLQCGNLFVFSSRETKNAK